MIRITTILILTVLTSLVGTANAQFTVLHSFAGGPNDGQAAIAGLTVVGSTLYGTTGTGGANGKGTVFKINADGTGYEVMYSFDGTEGPGARLTSNGTDLYGTTYSLSGGTVFKIGVNGSGFDTLHSFAGPPTDGSGFLAGMTLIGSTLYGTTSGGGSDSRGTIFKIDTDGTGYLSLHSFDGSSGSPQAAHLTQVGSVLFGATYGVFGANGGDLFKINTDGTAFESVHEFNVATESLKPFVGLTFDGTTLYGTTDGGGINNAGTVFKINPDGSGYELLHSFTNSGGVNGLVLSGTTLYGTTWGGGANNLGTIFNLNTDGTGFNVRHSFGVNAGGGHPSVDLTLVGSTLYGATWQGGANGKGTIFALTVPEPSSLSLGLSALAAGMLFLSRRRVFRD